MFLRPKEKPLKKLRITGLNNNINLLKMNNNRKYSLVLIFLILIITSFYQCKSSLFTDDIVFIENGKIKLGFENKTGRLVVFNDLVNNHEFIDQSVVNELPWEINFHSIQTNLIQTVEISPSKFSYSKPDSHTLILSWKDFDGMEEFEINAEITLDKNKAFSYWSIFIDGVKENTLDNLVFPKIAGLKDMENEELVIPTWMGSLMTEPRKALRSGRGKMEWSYPGALSSQVIAVYNLNKSGFYASCNDSLSYVKNFSLKLDSLNTLTYEMINYPSFDLSASSYSPNYQAIIGSFKGDWIDVAEIYGEWAVKQKWAKESRFKNGLTPSWLENTALWVWNRGKSDNVLKPAVELKERLGLPVHVFWHWWHNCSYDDNFPEYLPPREGMESFITAVKSAQNTGVNSHVYMNAIQWGDAAEGWKSGKVKPYTVKDIDGKERSHVYNIFTDNALINMCVGTEFWRDHYSSLCDSVINIYQTNGVYMDQTCLSRMCYDKSHGHEIGGGNYWVENSGKLIDQIRSKDFGDKQPIFTGEGSAENWLPHLDAFLTLQASRERYAGVGNTETIPFFQAVFHQYGITFGNYSSLVTPPYDELWPKEFAPENIEQPLDEIFNDQFLMEQARSFVWGMQPTIANYQSFLASEREEEINYLLNIARLRYKGLKYLLYGKFLRTPHIEFPEKEIDISRLSIYAGRKGEIVSAFKKHVPLLYSGTWKAEDNYVGIVLASISDKSIPIKFSFDTINYGLHSNGDIYIITNKGKEFLNSYTDRMVNVNFSLQPKGLCIIEISPTI
jgi:hypothetical protein